MSGPKFTPGPWHVELPMGDICFSIVDDAAETYNWKLLANATWDDKEDRGTGRPFITKKEAEANAHLIAAAPDLYAALEAMVAHAERMAPYYEKSVLGAVAMSRVALAKASPLPSYDPVTLKEAGK
jgi:hypothetical protein